MRRRNRGRRRPNGTKRKFAKKIQSYRQSRGGVRL